VDVELEPEPEAEVRAAVERALAQLDDARDPGPWWRAGVRENTRAGLSEP
jgi:hypothetical protein